MWITFSGGSGTLKLFFKCHCISTIYGVELGGPASLFVVNNPMRDMSCQTGQA